PATARPTVTIPSPTNGQALPAAGAVTLTWTMSDDVFLASYLHVWVNVTIGNQTIPLLADAVGATSVPWMTPDVAATGVVIRVDVQDPRGPPSSDARTVSLTGQSSLPLIIGVVL